MGAHVSASLTLAPKNNGPMMAYNDGPPPSVIVFPAVVNRPAAGGGHWQEHVTHARRASQIAQE
jgi:hypothetical protein